MIVTDRIDREIEEALQDSVTSGVLSIFEDICSVPHASGNEAELAAKIAERAEQMGCQTAVDASGNLMVSIPASEGCENAPVLMYQGHLDMVCAAAAGEDWDAEKDPVTVVAARDEKSGRPVIRSDRRSSLGADCGIGNAAALWVFDRERNQGEMKHGPVRLLFTVDEERGMVGVSSMDPAILDDVDYLINLDGFTGGRMIAGCAGGRRETWKRSCGVVPTRELVGYRIANTMAMEFCLKNFGGGHSGFDIDKGRINTLQFLCRILSAFRDSGADFALSSLRGGLAYNVIPSFAKATITIRKKDLSLLQESLLKVLAEIEEETGTRDDGIVSYYEVRVPEKSFDRESRDQLLAFAQSIPIGVLEYMEAFPEIVNTSCSLGRVEAEVSAESAEFMMFTRSTSMDRIREIAQEHAAAADQCGFELSDQSEYGSWEFERSNSLLDLAMDVYESVSGQKAEAGAVHIGIEPAVFARWKPQLNMISVGAEVHDPHTIYERCELNTIRPLALTLKEIAERVAAMKKDAE